MIQQFRMRRLRAEMAEIVRRPHQALAKDPLPDTIHHHPRSQRIPRTGNDAGQLTTSAAFKVEKRILRRDGSHISGWHRIPRLRVIPAQQHRL